MPVGLYTFDDVARVWSAPGRPDIPTGQEMLAWDWGEGREPWRQGAGAHPWAAFLPVGVPVVPLKVEAGGDFENQVTQTLNSAPARAIVELPPDTDGQYSSFKKLGSGQNPTYAFGFYHQKFAGFYTEGTPENVSVGMAANSVSAEQLTHMEGLTQASFAPLQMGMMRVDTQYQSAAAPVYFGGITFESAPQNPLTTIAPDITGGVFTPQAAPHQGLVLYSDSNRRHPGTVLSHVRFRGAGKAMNSQPPFEMGNITSQRNQVRALFSEFDGRMSPRFDASRPRKCGPLMTNGGVEIAVVDSWLHHSNVSRYAANDESVESGAALSNHYRVERVKIEQISNNQNRQPPLNGGASLGGYTDASCFGYESSNALVEHIDVIAIIDNPKTTGQVPAHVQFTNTGPARSGGRYVVRGGVFRHLTFPQLDGFLIARVSQNTAWWTDGFATTFDIQVKRGTPLQAHIHTGSWPPTQAQLDAAGVTPETHYIVVPTSV